MTASECMYVLKRQFNVFLNCRVLEVMIQRDPSCLQFQAGQLEKSPIHIAAEHGHIEVVKTILSNSESDMDAKLVKFL